jgi:sugar diacid utilization regulator
MNRTSVDGLIEPLSPRLRKVVERVLDDVDRVVDNVFDKVWALVPDYVRAGNPVLRKELHAAIALHAQLWFGALLRARAPTEEELGPAAEFARHRVHQGVSLAGMLRAFRIGTAGLWSPLLEAAANDPRLHHELLFKVSPYMLYHFDAVQQAMSQAYNREQFRQVRWRERLRQELWSVLLTRPDDVESFRTHAEALGLNAVTPHCAVALRLAEVPALTSQLEESVDRITSGIARTVGIDRDGFLHTVYRDCLVFWLPLAHGESLIDHDRSLAATAATLVKSVENVVAAGVGLPGTGPRGWRLSADQAVKAIERKACGDEPGVACRYSEIALDDAVATSENVTRFFQALLERLSHEPHLLETLQTYFGLRQHRKAVAAALKVHPNTLSYRLERIENLLGASLDSTAWVAKLHTALRLQGPGAPRRPAGR